MRPLLHRKTLPFKIESSDKMPALTSHVGFSLVQGALVQLGLTERMKSFGLKQAGYADEVVLECILLMLCAGGRSLSDFDYLKQEIGTARLLNGLTPSVDTLEDYLWRLSLCSIKRDSQAEGQAGYCSEIEILHKQLIMQAYRQAGNPQQLTIDIDTKIIETDKQAAHYCYELHKAYQPIHAYCRELNLVVAHEMRDGNLSPQEGYQRVIERVRLLFPQAKLTVCSDSAAYQHELLDWMQAQGIQYTVTVKQTQALKQELPNVENWHSLDKQTDYAYFYHTASFSSQEQLKSRSQHRDYYAIRREVPQNAQLDLFTGKYVYHMVMVTNLQASQATEILKHHARRFGGIEYAHSQLNQVGLDKLPSNNFGVNAAYYSLGILAHNLLRFLQQFILPESYKKLELQTLRFRLINRAAIIIKKARSLILRLATADPLYAVLRHAYKKLQLPSPPVQHA